MRLKLSILEEIFSNKKVDVLLETYEKGEITSSDLMGVVSNPNYLKKIVDGLEDEMIIGHRKVGKRKVLVPNVAANTDVYAAIEIVRKARFLKAQKMIAPYLNELVKRDVNSSFILVYGSYASGTNTPDSDIDICIASTAKETEIKRLVSEIFSSSGTKVQLLLESADEFREARDKLHESIVLPKNRIVLSGMHNFLAAAYSE